MVNRATYTAEYLNDGHLSMPQEIAHMLALESGKKVRVIIESSKFNKEEFLKLFGIWKQKNTDQIKIFMDVFKERIRCGRDEIKL